MRTATSLLLLLLLVPGLLRAQPAGPENVAVLVNGELAQSVDVGQHYAHVRGIPEENVCVLDASAEYETTLAAYQAEVRDPFVECLGARGLTDQVLFVVVVWGVPGVIGDGGPPVIGQSLRSVDSFLADPFDEFTSDDNPYFEAELPFRRENGFSGYLVTRLDGPTPEIALALVDRAQVEPQVPGIGWFDQEPKGSGPLDREVIAGAGAIGNGWIVNAHQWLGDAGFEVRMDEHDAEYGTAPAPLTCPDARWYLGWYEAYHYNDAFQWLPGAVGIHIDSFSAMNFRQEGSWCAGALAAGLTATAGAVWEPHVGDFVHGHLLLKAYAVDGFTLAEAAWQAIPRLRWMNVVFGDPLLRYTPPEPSTPDPPVETPEDTYKPEDVIPVDTAEPQPVVDNGCAVADSQQNEACLLILFAALLATALTARRPRYH